MPIARLVANGWTKDMEVEKVDILRGTLKICGDNIPNVAISDTSIGNLVFKEYMFIHFGEIQNGRYLFKLDC